MAPWILESWSKEQKLIKKTGFSPYSKPWMAAEILTCEARRWLAKGGLGTYIYKSVVIAGLPISLGTMEEEIHENQWKYN